MRRVDCTWSTLNRANRLQHAEAAADKRFPPGSTLSKIRCCERSSTDAQLLARPEDTGWASFCWQHPPRPFLFNPRTCNRVCSTPAPPWKSPDFVPSSRLSTLTMWSICRAAVFVGPVPEDSLPKDATLGCSLAGSMKLAKCSTSNGDSTAPTHCRLLFTVPPPACKRKDDAADDDANDVPEEELPAAQALKEARRDADVRLCLAACI
jgi:hypothetical protein